MQQKNTSFDWKFHKTCRIWRYFSLIINYLFSGEKKSSVLGICICDWYKALILIIGVNSRTPCIARVQYHINTICFFFIFSHEICNISNKVVENCVLPDRIGRCFTLISLSSLKLRYFLERVWTCSFLLGEQYYWIVAKKFYFNKCSMELQWKGAPIYLVAATQSIEFEEADCKYQWIDAIPNESHQL